MPGRRSTSRPALSTPTNVPSGRNRPDPEDPGSTVPSFHWTVTYLELLVMKSASSVVEPVAMRWGEPAGCEIPTTSVPAVTSSEAQPSSVTPVSLRTVSRPKTSSAKSPNHPPTRWRAASSRSWREGWKALEPPRRTMRTCSPNRRTCCVRLGSWRCSERP